MALSTAPPDGANIFYLSAGLLDVQALGAKTTVSPHLLVVNAKSPLKATYLLPEVVSCYESVGVGIVICSSPAQMAAELRTELEAEKALLKRLNIAAM